MVMFPSLAGIYLPALFLLLPTTCCRWIRFEKTFLDPMVFQVEPLVQWAVTQGMTSSLLILTKSIANIETLLVCTMFFTLAFVPAIAKSAMPFASYAALPTLHDHSEILIRNLLVNSTKFSIF